MQENEKKALMEKLADKIIEKKLATPAIFLLETMKPLSFVGNQILVFLQPLINLFAEIKDYPKITELLEERENMEKMILLVEAKEAEKKPRAKSQEPRAKRKGAENKEKS